MRTVSLIVGSLVLALAVTGCKKDKKKEKPPAVVVDAAVRPPDPPPVRSLKLKEVPAKVGDKRTKTDDVTVVFQLDVRGKKVDVKTIEHQQESVELLAVDGKIPTKIRIAYSGLSSTQTVGAKVTNKPEILDGKTFIVWSENGTIKATTAAGAAVSRAELTELANENDELGKPDVMEQILGDHTWVIGETYNFTADDLAKLKARSSNPAKPVATAMSLTLTSFDDKQALFALTASLAQNSPKDQLSFTMKGTARVELPSTHPTELVMDGTLTGMANGMATSGTMTAKTAYTY